MTSSAVIILSGGMDSGVLMAHSLPKYAAVHALSFHYGSKHNDREIPCAVQLCKHYQVPHHIVQLGFMNELLDSSLLKSGAEIPSGTYNDTNMRSTVVPFRNGVMLSIAVAYAENIKAQHVLIGSHAGDHSVYPDCRPEFTQAMSEAARHGTYAEVQVFSPFNNLTKSQIAAIGRQINFDFRMTWTCYRGGEIHCGSCAACNERKQALGHEDGTDPTEYEIPAR